MIEAGISLAIVLPLTALFSMFIYKKLTPKWDGRENYGFKAEQWKRPLLLSTIIASAFTVVLALAGTKLFIGTALGLLVFFLTATALTDAKTHLIPKELSNMALIVGLVTGGIGFVTSQYYLPDFATDQYTQFIFQATSFGAYMFAISLLFVVIMFAPVIGFGDIKMFWATGLFIGSFVVFDSLLAIFMLMFIIMGFQLIFGMIKAKSWKIADGLPALPAFAMAFVTLTLALNL